MFLLHECEIKVVLQLYSNSSTMAYGILFLPENESTNEFNYLPSDSKSVSNSSSMPRGWVGDDQSSSFKQRDSKDAVNIAVRAYVLFETISQRRRETVFGSFIHLVLCVLYGLVLWNEIGLRWTAGNSTPQVTCRVWWHQQFMAQCGYNHVLLITSSKTIGTTRQCVKLYGLR